MALTRRAFSNTALLAVAGYSTTVLAGITGRARQRGERVFQHGIASGDPLHDRVLLWTRVTPRRVDRPVLVRWQIAGDPEMRRSLGSGSVDAQPERDFTVKVDAGGLEPGRTYYYRFDCEGEASVIGRTRTLPTGAVAQLRFAVVSCSNLPFGWFNVYANLAARSDLDAVLHLGDYLYEYAPGEYGDGRELGRAHSPAREVSTLADYRARHAQYKADADLQAAHRQHPWITAWDDHEFADNAWFGGAKNHNTNEGDWLARKAAAMRAYAEWMPIRELPDGDAGLRTWRSFAFGDLADLVMLDTRVHGRAVQVPRSDRAGQGDPRRSLLGADQEDWLTRELRHSQQRRAGYRLLGQQVLFGQMVDAERHAVNTDSWDGYAASRDRVFQQLQQEQIDNVVVLTGDLHSAWALDLTPDPFGRYDPGSGKGSLAVEMVTPAVTSPSPFANADAAAAGELRTLQNSPHVKYLNYRQRGYLLVDLTPERAQGDWYFVDSIALRTRPDILGASYAAARGENRLQRVSSASRVNANRPPNLR